MMEVSHRVGNALPKVMDALVMISTVYRYVSCMKKASSQQAHVDENEACLLSRAGKAARQLTVVMRAYKIAFFNSGGELQQRDC